jgi:hypothetical protein
MSAKTFTDEPLEQSQTLQKLSVLAHINPINVDDKATLDSALASSLVWLADALDRNAIQFNDPLDRSALWQMLLVVHQLITQIRPASSVRH